MVSRDRQSRLHRLSGGGVNGAAGPLEFLQAGLGLPLVGGVGLLPFLGLLLRVEGNRFQLQAFRLRHAASRARPFPTPGKGWASNISPPRAAVPPIEPVKGSPRGAG